MLLLCILPLIGSLAWTTRAATIPSRMNTIETTALSNLTSAQLQTQSGDNVFRMAYCTKMSRWSVPKLEPEDCMGMLDYLYIETADSMFHKSKEFRAPGAKVSHGPPVPTPRKYTFGNHFPPQCPEAFLASILQFNKNHSSHRRQSLNLPKNSHSQLTSIFFFFFCTQAHAR